MPGYPGINLLELWTGFYDSSSIEMPSIFEEHPNKAGRTVHNILPIDLLKPDGQVRKPDGLLFSILVNSFIIKRTVA